MSEMFLQNLARGLGSFFNNAAPAYAMSGMTTPYGRSSPGINVNARGSGNPFNATNRRFYVRYVSTSCNIR